MDHQVDHVVTGHVRQPRVLIPQVAPRGEVTKRLVQVLVQDQATQLFIIELVAELAPVLGVAPIGTGCRHGVIHLGLAQHDDAGVQTVVSLTHQPYVCLLDTLFNG